MRALVACVCLSVLAALAAPGAQHPVSEYDVKAAFVLNFIRYVEWPPKQRVPPFRLCLYRQNPFGDRLQAMVAGERWHGGDIRVDVVREAREIAACHLVYVPADAQRRFTAMAAPRLAKRPVLVVGEHEDLLDDGGMIRLFVEDQKIRFSINQGLALEAGLQVSSRLLRLARGVVGTRGAK